MGFLDNLLNYIVPQATQPPTTTTPPPTTANQGLVQQWYAASQAAKVAPAQQTTQQGVQPSSTIAIPPPTVRQEGIGERIVSTSERTLSEVGSFLGGGARTVSSEISSIFRPIISTPQAQSIIRTVTPTPTEAQPTQLSQFSRDIYTGSSRVANVIDTGMGIADIGARRIERQLPAPLSEIYSGAYQIGRGLVFTGESGIVRTAGMIPGGVETIAKRPEMIPTFVSSGVATQISGLGESVTQRPLQTLGEIAVWTAVGKGTAKTAELFRAPNMHEFLVSEEASAFRRGEIDPWAGKPTMRQTAESLGTEFRGGYKAPVPFSEPSLLSGESAIRSSTGQFQILKTELKSPELLKETIHETIQKSVQESVQKQVQSYDISQIAEQTPVIKTVPTLSDLLQIQLPLQITKTSQIQSQKYEQIQMPVYDTTQISVQKQVTEQTPILEVPQIQSQTQKDRQIYFPVQFPVLDQPQIFPQIQVQPQIQRQVQPQVTSQIQKTTFDIPQFQIEKLSSLTDFKFPSFGVIPEKKKRKTKRKITSYIVKNQLADLEDVLGSAIQPTNGSSSKKKKEKQNDFSMPNFELPIIDFTLKGKKQTNKRK